MASNVPNHWYLKEIQISVELLSLSHSQYHSLPSHFLFQHPHPSLFFHFTFSSCQFYPLFHMLISHFHTSDFIRGTVHLSHTTHIQHHLYYPCPSLIQSYFLPFSSSKLVFAVGYVSTHITHSLYSSLAIYHSPFTLLGTYFLIHPLDRLCSFSCNLRVCLFTTISPFQTGAAMYLLLHDSCFCPRTLFWPHIIWHKSTFLSITPLS